MATRTGRNAEAGAQAPVTVSAEAVAHIIAQIDGGLMDPFLRAMWDAAVSRKKVLEADDALPVQQKVTPRFIEAEPDEPERKQIRMTIGDPQPAFIDQQPAAPSAPVRRKNRPTKSSTLGHVSARPVLNTTNLVPTEPLTSQQWRTADERSFFVHGGLRYPKDHFKGHQVDGLTSSGAAIRFQISGVGDKSIKCYIVTEPPRDAVSGKTRLWDKWNANDPVFMPHALIEPWLIIPTSNINAYT